MAVYALLPGGSRPLKSRWIVEAALVAEGPIHLGSGDEGDFVDLELIRDPLSGRPLLTGASLAGGLRDYLCDILAGDRVIEDGRAPEVAAVFGGRSGDPDGDQSPLIVFDAIGQAAEPEIRDHVRLNPTTGVAAGANQTAGAAGRGGKFDMEVWPRATSFPIRCDVLVPGADTDAVEAQRIAGLVLALEGLANGEVAIGAKATRGFGRCKLSDVRATRYALGADAKGWLQYLQTGLNGEPLHAATIRPQATPTQAVVAAWPVGNEHVGGRPASLPDALSALQTRSRRRVVEIEVDVEFPGGLLMAGTEAGIAGADRRHIHSGGPVVTGTGLAGAMRQRARRIADVVRGPDGPRWVEDLFGSEPGGQPGSRGELVGSRVSIHEVRLDAGHSLQVTRIQVDRFTQAPVEGALLQEEPVYRARTRLRFRIGLPSDRARADGLAGLFVLTLKDLLLGDVPLGGTVGVGRGGARPRPDGELLVRIEGQSVSWRFAELPSEPTRTLLDGWVQAFRTRQPVTGETTHA